MKNIILKILRTGFSETKKYSAKQLNNYMFVLDGLFCDRYGLIVADVNNHFWDYYNKKNREELIHDLSAVKRRSVQDTAYFRILNRFANGDKYGIA